MTPTLFMLLIGCNPPGRNTEQHDVFFGIAENIRDLIPEVTAFWPGNNKIHFDAWREVTRVNNCKVQVVPAGIKPVSSSFKLFFINLGGYKQHEFEEFHYKMLIAAPGKAEAVDEAKRTAFFRHTGFKGATSHIDDKYGVDVDDVHEIADILSNETKQRYSLIVTPDEGSTGEDELHLGYFKLSMFV